MKFSPPTLFKNLFLSQCLVAGMAVDISSSGVDGRHRRLDTSPSYLPDGSGTMLATLYISAVYLRYGVIQAWGTDIPPYANKPTTIDSTFFSGAIPVKVANGILQQCALLDNKKVACWGRNAEMGAMGDGLPNGTIEHPVIVKLNDENGVPQDLDDVVDIASGVSHTCAVKSDKSILCFGDNNESQLTANSYYDGTAPETQVRFVSTGGYHTCVVSEANEVRCFGRNNGHNGSTPTRFTPDDKVIQISGHGSHYCILMDMPSEADVNVKCFGANYHGQLGNGAVSGAWSTTPVTPNVLDSKLTFVSAGDHTTCVIKASDNSQWCWGLNEKYRLGVSDDEETKLEPAKVITTSHLDQTKIRSIHAHGKSGHVLLTDGSLHAWGGNFKSLLGLGIADENSVIHGTASAQPVFSNAGDITTEPADWAPLPGWLETGSSNSSTETSTPSFAPSRSSFPSLRPSSKPSLSFAPSSAPSSQPSSKPSVSGKPTSAIEKAASQQALDYIIRLKENSVDVSFDNNSSDGEITFALEVTKDRSDEIQPFKIHDYTTCGDDEFTSDIITVTYTDPSSTIGAEFDTIPVNLDINTGKLTDYTDSIYSENSSTNTATIQFCVLAAIGSIPVTNNGITSYSTISSVKLAFDVDINLEVGFSDASVEVKQTEATDESQTVDIEYPGK